MEALAERLESQLTPRAAEYGLELVAVEMAGGEHQPIVRVYLDREGGIDLDAICEANSWVSDELERVQELGGAYTLEVSSPGIERPLRKLDDFERFAGRTAAIKTRPVEGRSSFTGTVDGVKGEDVLVTADGTQYRIPVGSIKKAKLKVDIDFDEEGSGESQ
jgi:ribosome maturation factor RimP